MLMMATQFESEMDYHIFFEIFRFYGRSKSFIWDAFWCKTYLHGILWWHFIKKSCAKSWYTCRRVFFQTNTAICEKWRNSAWQFPYMLRTLHFFFYHFRPYKLFHIWDWAITSNFFLLCFCTRLWCDNNTQITFV